MEKGVIRNRILRIIILSLVLVYGVVIFGVTQISLKIKNSDKQVEEVKTQEVQDTELEYNGNLAL